MKPACTLQRKAQALPNSSGQPSRPDGFCSLRTRIASSKSLPAAFARAPTMPRSRSVSKEPGSRPLMVTLWRTVWRERPATKPGSPLRRAIRQAEEQNRRFHRGGGDVDDAPELARDHPVDRAPDQLDWPQHQRVERLEPILAAPVAEIAGRRAAGIVDEDVGLGTGRQRSLSALGRGDV